MAEASQIATAGDAGSDVSRAMEPFPRGRSPFSRPILNIGFFVGLVLAVACLLLSTFYLVRFEAHANSGVTSALEAAQNDPSSNQLLAMQFSLSVHMYIARILLLSCGIFAGLSFGFLGFALFLIGVEGAVAASLEGTGGLRVSVARLAPGAFVILCAAILIGVCARGSLPARVSADGVVTTPQPGATEGGAPDAASEAVNGLDERSPEEAGVAR